MLRESVFAYLIQACKAGASVSSLLLLTSMLAACGPSAPEYQPAATRRTSTVSEQGTEAPIIADKQATEATPSETPAASSGSTTSEGTNVPPAPVPPTPAAPTQAIRTLPNAAEKTAMTNLYASPTNAGGCVACHGALAMSEKKGRTAQQITNAQNLFQHRAVAAANKWPKDTADSTNDGVDNAQLHLSALVEVLK